MRTSILALVTMLYLVSPVGASTVGWWRFEEGTANAVASGSNTVLDSSGNGLNGTPVAGPVYRADVPPPGPASNTRSLDFNGSSGHRVQIPDSPSLALTQNMTLEAFIKPRPFGSGTVFSVIIMRGDDRIGLDPYILGMQSPGNIVSFQIVAPDNQYEYLSAPVPYDQWSHVAGTLDDATGAMKLYVNNVQVASTTTALRPVGPLDPGWSPGVSIGGTYSGAYGGFFNGLIDEARISNTALVPGQLLPEPTSAMVLLIGGALMSRGRRRGN